MGATQSSTGAQPDNGTAVAKTCFYEILGLEKDAADTEYVYCTDIRHLETN